LLQTRALKSETQCEVPVLKAKISAMSKNKKYDGQNVTNSMNNSGGFYVL